MKYRFLNLAGLMLIGYLNPITAQNVNDSGQAERKYLIQMLTHIADPVLINLSQNKLHERMPVEGKEEARKNYTHLEAFARLLAGMAHGLNSAPITKQS